MDFVYDYKEDEGYDADAVAEMDTDELKTYLKHTVKSIFWKP